MASVSTACSCRVVLSSRFCMAVSGPSTPCSIRASVCIVVADMLSAAPKASYSSWFEPDESMAMSGVLGRIMGVLTDYDSPFEVESYSISGSGLILEGGPVPPAACSPCAAPLRRGPRRPPRARPVAASGSGMLFATERPGVLSAAPMPP